MSYNGHLVVDMDCHIREYEDLDRTYRENIDPKYRDAYERLSTAVHARERRPGDQVLFMNSNAVVWPVPPRRPLGVYDTFGSERSASPEAQGVATVAEARARQSEIDRACHWDPSIRLRDMDVAGVDVSVMFASQSDGFCTLRDVGFESALQEAYHRYMTAYCAESDGQLRWVGNSNLRDVPKTLEWMSYWAEQDDNFAGMFIPRACPDGRLLDNPDLWPIYERSQDLDLPLWVHGGTMRPPLTPGATELDNSGFIINAVYHGWGGQTAVAALIGGGVFDLFPKLRIGAFESGAGWMPWLIERLDEAYSPTSSMTPHLKRLPSEVVAEGRLFCAVDPGEKFIELCVEDLGEHVWLFSTDYPHGGGCWPEGVPLITKLERLSERAKIKMLGENATRFLPSLAR